MESLLLKELEKELLRLKVLFAVSENHADYLQERPREYGYLQGRIEELEQVIGLIKQLERK